MARSVVPRGHAPATKPNMLTVLLTRDQVTLVASALIGARREAMERHQHAATKEERQFYNAILADYSELLNNIEGASWGA